MALGDPGARGGDVNCSGRLSRPLGPMGAEWLTRQEQALEGERMTSPELDIDYDSSQKLG